MPVDGAIQLLAERKKKWTGAGATPPLFIRLTFPPPARIVAAHAVLRIAVDFRLDVRDAEVAQGRAIDRTQDAHRFALRPPHQEAGYQMPHWACVRALIAIGACG